MARTKPHARKLTAQNTEWLEDRVKGLAKQGQNGTDKEIRKREAEKVKINDLLEARRTGKHVDKTAPEGAKKKTKAQKKAARAAAEGESNGGKQATGAPNGVSGSNGKAVAAPRPESSYARGGKDVIEIPDEEDEDMAEEEEEEEDDAADETAGDMQIESAHSKYKLPARGTGAVTAQGIVNGDDDEQLDGYHQEAEMLEKDDDELELERAVFGDAADFREQIKGFGKTQTSVLERDEADEDGADGGLDFEGVPDQALFFMDTAGDQGAAGLPQDGHGDLQLLPLDSGNNAQKRKLAWEDSDDERISVSLASVPRLRKLRMTADEDVVSGKEYIRRLQKQYTLLNPTPDWLTEARHAPKKRRLSANSSDSAASDSDADAPDSLTTAPLTSLLRSTASLTTKFKRRYHAGTLTIERQPDLSPVQPSAITSLHLHPTLPLLLTSGPSGTVHLHHLSPSPPAATPNPLLTTLHLRNTPLSSTAFLSSTSPKILLSARRRYFHSWDLASGKVEKITRVYGQAHQQRSMEVLKPSPDGRYVALQGTSKKGGVVNVLRAETMQFATSLAISSRGGVADFVWWRDGRGLSVVGKDGEVWEWNVDDERVVGRWRDEGAVGTTCIALGGETEFKGESAVVGGDRWVAVGSTAGIVNLYDRRAWYEGWQGRKKVAKEGQLAIENGSGARNGAGGMDVVDVIPTNPKPSKTFDHLTTPTSNLAFSQDGQLLVMSSKWKRDALKMVHTGSGTVYKNWPTSATPLGRVTASAIGRVDVGKKGQGEDRAVDVLVVGNEAGKLRLWEIRP